MRDIEDIKFRGKRIDNGEWEYGYLLDCPIKTFICNDFEEDEAGWCFWDKKEVIPKTVGQFTGLHDNTKWEQLSEKEKKKFWNENNSEDGKTIKYPTVDSIKNLWKRKRDV